MNNEMIEQVLKMLVVDIAQTRDCSVRIETQCWTALGRDIVELRVFLNRHPLEMLPHRWIGFYRNQLKSVLRDLGLQLAVDEWFEPSPLSPSCGCWITGTGSQLN